MAQAVIFNNNLENKKDRPKTVSLPEALVCNFDPYPAPPRLKHSAVGPGKGYVQHVMLDVNAPPFLVPRV